MKHAKPGRLSPKMKKITLIALITLAVLAAAVLTLHFINNRQVEFTGLPAERVTVECGSEYAPPEVTAELHGNIFNRGGTPLEVELEGEANTAKVGEYELTWSVSYFLGSQSRSCVVEVVDTTPPVITLTPEEREYVLPGTDYDDPGYSAVDTVDGDLTAAVVRVINDKIATYTVSDSSGNVAAATREIPFNDPVPPEITLKGEKSITFTVGEATFEEPGYTATDNLDGDITDKVEVKGSVDNNNPGYYTIRYTVKDSYGNETTVRRSITIRDKNGKVPGDEDSPEVDGTGKVIYLTFDDGPSAYTEKLLDVLKKYNVKATFFVVKTGRVDLIAREAAEGHTVAIHSLTHDYGKIYTSEEAYFADLDAMNEIIKEQTGSYATLLRFPGGSSNTVSAGYSKGIMTRLAKAVEERGYKYFDWNVSSGDAGGTTSTEQVYKNVVNGCAGRKYSVVLQHDIKGFSVNAVEKIIVWGLEHGYTFLPLTQDSPGAHHKLNN